MPAHRLSPEEIYLRLKALASEMPDFPSRPGGSDDVLMWIGRARAALSIVCNPLQMAAFDTAAQNLSSYIRGADNGQTIRLIFFQGLAKAEAMAPAGAQGSFIAVKSPVDAFISVQQVVAPASKSVMFIDPYMSVAIRDFLLAVPQGVRVRLLTTPGRSSDDFPPLVTRWPAQYPTRPLEARLAPKRRLHDRGIIVDERDAWAVSQSFKDLAATSPATVQKLDPDAAMMKIEFYSDLWDEAELL